MADKMMRIAGRNAEGVAKAVSVEEDNEGVGVIRTVDAAPFAYDEDQNAKRVTIVGQEEQQSELMVVQKKIIQPSDEITIAPGDRYRKLLSKEELGNGHYLYALPAIFLGRDLTSVTEQRKYTIRIEIKDRQQHTDGAIMLKLFEHQQTVADRGLPEIVDKFVIPVGDRPIRIQITNDDSEPMEVSDFDLYLLKG